MKKLFCFLLIGLMLLALLPMGAVARESLPAERDLVESIGYVYAAVPFPEKNQSPVTTIEIEEYNDYEFGSLQWIKSDGEQEHVMTEEEIFDDEGSSYRFELVLNAKPGFAFDEDAYVRSPYDGAEFADILFEDDDTTLRIVSIEFDCYGMPFAPIAIETVELIDYDTPVYGASPYYGIMTDPGVCTWTDINWFWEVDGSVRELGKYDYFTNSGSYYMVIYLTHLLNYAFTDDTAAVINDDPALVDEVTYDAETDMLIVKTAPFVVADPEYIDRIDIGGFTEPELGQVIESPNVQDIEGIRYDGCDWTKTVGDIEQYVWGTFDDEDASYKCYMYFWIMPGYEVTDDFTVAINGESALVGNVKIENRHVEVQTVGFVPGEVPVPPAVPGDINGDGEVSTEDALLVLRAALGITEYSDELVSVCDMDGDGVVDTTDALLILRLALGITPQ